MTPKDRHEQARRLSESYRKASRKENADARCVLHGDGAESEVRDRPAAGPPEKPLRVTAARKRKQKNWTHVRRLVGWERIDTRAAVDLLNDLYCNEWRWMMNLFQPSVKLLRKERIGSRVRRVYDAPATPLDRLLRDGQGSPSRLNELIALRNRIDPFRLSNQIQAKIDRVHQLARRPGQPSASTITPGSERSNPLLDPPPQRGGGRPHPEVADAHL